MRIHFERTGGFAGIPLTATIDLDTLTPAESKHLRELIDAPMESEQGIVVDG